MSPTKQRALNLVEERNIEDLLTYFGAGNRSLYDDLPKKGELGATLMNIMNNIKGIVEESQVGTQSTNERPYSNERIWGTQSDGEYIGTRNRATPEEMQRGDTLGGNPSYNSHPERKETQGTPKMK
jgi:hypothetical protein